MSIHKKAKIPGYKRRVWFRRRDITNTIALKNLTEQYRVTCDRNDQMFIVHRERVDLPKMEFLMHDSGLHYYEPPKKDLLTLNTVSRNNEGFSKI